MASKKTKTRDKKTDTAKSTVIAKSSVKSKTQTNGKLSILDAAARVLKESDKPMSCKQMVEKMLAAKYWKTNGKTPAATLSSAMLREIKTKGKESRFHKTERGQFSLA